MGKLPNNGQAAGDRRVCPPIWLYGLAVVVILCGLLVLGSGSAAGANGEADRFGILSPSQKVAASDFTLEDPSGTPVRLRDFRGKIVFINFWATWCIPCRAEMPAIQQLYQEFQEQGLVVAAVNFQDAPEAVLAFSQELQLTFPIPLDRKGTVASAYGVRGLPASYIVNREGQIIGQAIGGREWESKDAKAYFQWLLSQ
jgi:peroxiredoxin